MHFCLKPSVCTCNRFWLRAQSPTSKENPPICCLISCKAKGVVYHQVSECARERPPERPPGDIQHPSVVQHEAEPKQLRVRGNSQEILGLHGVPKRYGDQPGKSAGHIGTRTPKDSKGSAELKRKSCGPKQIRLQSNR